MSELNEENLSLEAADLLQSFKFLPSGREALSLKSHGLRSERLRRTPGFYDIQRILVARRITDASVDMPFMTARGIRDTFENTQLLGENHRRLAPRLQEMLHYPDTHASLMHGIEEACLNDTERLLKTAKENNGQLSYDVAILGSGPHGTAAAIQMCEEFPELSILMVDSNGLGGMWNSYGPNPSFRMNSRVRKADCTYAPIPRTPGNINPLGRFATLELSDVVTGNYALNTEMGDVTAINAYLSVDATLLGCECECIEDRGIGASMYLSAPDGNIEVNVGIVINACGISQESTLELSSIDQDAPWYFDTADIYSHYGNAKGRQGHRPLERFHLQDIVAIGGGDGLLTSFEAILGNLPPQTYGAYGVARCRPNSIAWVGAPGETAKQIDECLRSRYKDGIVQALPKYSGDQGAIIRPVPVKARSLQERDGRIEVTLADGSSVRGDVVFDHTNQAQATYGPEVIDSRRNKNLPKAVFGVGPGAKPELPQTTREIISQLGIGENTVSLWALMGVTNRQAILAGGLAYGNRRRR